MNSAISKPRRKANRAAKIPLEVLLRKGFEHPIPPSFKPWRVFLDCRPLEIAITESAEAAVACVAACYSLPRHRLAALDEDFVAQFERRLERHVRKRLSAICHHEAGHAVMALHLGAHVVSLSTLPQMIYGGDIPVEQDSLARIRLETSLDHARWVPGTASDTEGRALIALAGLAAEFYFTGRARWASRSWEGDIKRAAGLAEAFAQTAQEKPAVIFEHWKATAQSTVENLWTHVARIAVALKEQRVLTAEDLVKLVPIL